MSKTTKQIKEFTSKEYKYGFTTDIKEDRIPSGLNEDIIKKISKIKKEPKWLLEWRLKSYKSWLKMKEPKWSKLKYPKIDFNAICYYSAPKKKKLKSLDEVDPELLKTYDKLGIPLDEQKMLSGVAVDAVFDSVSVVTTFKKTLKEAGVIFCPFSESVKDYP